MSTIEQSENDTPKVIEDKVRALPANQGKNEDEMRQLIEAEIETSKKDKKVHFNEDTDRS